MDTKLKKYSHLLATKIIIFIIMILCFTGAINAVLEVEIKNDGDFGVVFEDDYYLSRAFVEEGETITGDLTRLLGEFKNEENIVNGGTISEEELRSEEEILFEDYHLQSKNYNPNLSEDENYKKFKEEYADKISHAKDMLIKNDIREFHVTLQKLGKAEGSLYYASDGVNVYTNTTKTEKGQFKTYPAYMVFENYQKEIYPKELEENQYVDRITQRVDELNPENQVLYVSFTEKFLNSKIKEWNENKELATKNFYLLLICLAGFIVSFVYLVLVIGRKSFKDQELHVHAFDKLYNDINIVIFIALIAFWVAMLEELFNDSNIIILLLTIPLAALGFGLVLSLVKHLKNRTFFKHTLIYTIISKLVHFIGDVYKSGSVGVKTVLIVVGYPLLVAATFFMFPITIGLAAWFAHKKIKAFLAIKEGVERIKDGNLHHSIDVGGKGEFAGLAANINSITDGLKKAVDSELKSERLKTELITNVSHDIRTPLTSIITYVDLLKNEQDPSKVEQYIEVLDQKSKRLKILTDDLFDAAKATSGTIPVQFERIDIISLISQGLGEVNDRIEDLDLMFKFHHPQEKVYIAADGKLLWRSIENVLSNIFKYALPGSRVYIDIEEAGNEVLLTFKNISAYELNISADELMERFKRGDESRSSNGSGLGLSIAKSLIEIQKGKFMIQVDGDLFKSMICLPKYSE
ncbi:HAMP domain-containing sensor histidine kinase [Neobacillus niacini]|uniref:HAMP domain-containing sensor histidine kinase n=1 Tax=Neobacillus niacini TaxID=86668 RepID=UPI0007AB7A39|nr:HAMP domain-containing sensor histidine kinase [Neobacillus niacini]MEC1520537.1 HAMP domain-containing sensor histidine kinase [Neobacillus niacini]